MTRQQPDDGVDAEPDAEHDLASLAEPSIDQTETESLARFQRNAVGGATHERLTGQVDQLLVRSGLQQTRQAQDPSLGGAGCDTSQVSDGGSCRGGSLADVRFDVHGVPSPKIATKSWKLIYIYIILAIKNQYITQYFWHNNQQGIAA